MADRKSVLVSFEDDHVEVFIAIDSEEEGFDSETLARFEVNRFVSEAQAKKSAERFAELVALREGCTWGSNF